MDHLTSQNKLSFTHIPPKRIKLRRSARGGEFFSQDLTDPWGKRAAGSLGFMISPHRTSRLKLQTDGQKVNADLRTKGQRSLDNSRGVRLSFGEDISASIFTSTTGIRRSNSTDTTIFTSITANSPATITGTATSLTFGEDTSANTLTSTMGNEKGLSTSTNIITSSTVSFSTTTTGAACRIVTGRVSQPVRRAGNTKDVPLQCRGRVS